MNDLQQPCSLLERVMWIRNRGKIELLAYFFVLAWGVWGQRNKWLYEKVITHPKAASLLSLFIDCSKTITLTLNTVGCWQPLESGFLKLNIDGANFDNLQIVGLGAVLRDSKGDVVFATT